MEDSIRLGGISSIDGRVRRHGRLGCQLLLAKAGKLRDPGLFFALLLIIGPGIVVNGLFKPFWNRPRPHATIPFGGPRDFVAVWQRGSGQDDSSFPSGHAAMGFYLMAPAMVCYRRRPRLAAAFLLLGIAAGTVIGSARIVAGCHFASDVLWSGGLVYFTALLLAAPFRFGQGEPVWAKTPVPSGLRRGWCWGKSPAPPQFQSGRQPLTTD